MTIQFFNLMNLNYPIFPALIDFANPFLFTTVPCTIINESFVYEFKEGEEALLIQKRFFFVGLKHYRCIG
jgi:hypothetical protein